MNLHNYFKNMNNKIVKYKYGDNLSYYLTMNKKIIKLLKYNQNQYHQKGGNIFSDVIMAAFSALDKDYSNIMNALMQIKPSGIDNGILKLLKYLILNVYVLSNYFPDNSLIELRQQITEIDELMKIKLKKLED